MEPVLETTPNLVVSGRKCRSRIAEGWETVWMRVLEGIRYVFNECGTQ